MPTTSAPTVVAHSPLPTPASLPPQDESILFIRPNGDVVRYTLADQRELLLLEKVYFFPEESERKDYFALTVPMRPSPDGQWLLVPTPDQGTWLVAMDGSSRRQISPNALSATWAPDSQQITYLSRQKGTANNPDLSILYTENIVTEEAPRPLLKSEAGSGWFAIWSPGCTTTPTPENGSCGRHIVTFFDLNVEDNELAQALLVNVETGMVTPLGPYAGPARETIIYEYRWSPDGDEFWVPGPSSMGLIGTAYQVDGTPQRVLVSAYDGSTVIWERRDGELVTEGGWTIRYETPELNEAILLQSPTGEQHEIATGAYFVDTLAQLRSTEVAQEEAQFVTMREHRHPDDWNERVLRDLGMSYRLPPEWEERGTDEGKNVRNFRFAAPVGMASLSDQQVNVHIGVTPIEGNGDAYLALWRETAANQGTMPDDPLVSYFIDDYDEQVYQVTGEATVVANHPAVRLRSTLWPLAEKVFLLFHGITVEVTILSRPSALDPLVEQILASITLPNQAADTPPSPLPTPVAPSPLATP